VFWGVFGVFRYIKPYFRRGNTGEVPRQNIDVSGQNIDVPRQNIDVLRQNIDVLRQNIDVSGQNIDVLRQNIDVLRQNIDVLRQNIDVLSRTSGGEKPVSSIEGLLPEAPEAAPEAEGMTLMKQPEAAEAPEAAPV
jgi:prefoldin subunit 5